MQAMARTFEDLVAEADSVSVDGWDFSWLDGRATEERPSWGYQRLLSSRLETVSAALDIHTGGGEVLSGAGPFPPTMAAIETWPPNAALATKRLHPLGVVLVATRDEPPLPFAEFHPDTVSAQAQAAGLQILDLRMERLRAEFFDIGAVIYFLRKVVWTVPDFTVERYRDRLRELHKQIEAQGPFVAHPTRVLVEAHKPG